MTQTAQILHAIARFDAAACGDCAVDDALHALAEAYGAQAITLETRQRATGEMIGFEEWGIDPASAAPYQEHFEAISPRVAHGMRASHDTIAHDDLIAPPEVLERDPFYGEFLEPYGLRYFLSLTIDPDPSIFSVIALQFQRSCGPVEREDIQIAQALRPILAERFGQAWRRERGMHADFVMADLKARFALTPSEARLAISLLSGGGVVEHAARAGITRNTAYSHYAAVKAKLGETRQAALITKLTAIYPTFTAQHSA